jgi:hypothetical protein
MGGKACERECLCEEQPVRGTACKRDGLCMRDGLCKGLPVGGTGYVKDGLYYRRRL